MTPIEEAVNIGPVLARELQRSGIASLEQLVRVGYLGAWRKLHSAGTRQPCVHTCLALAGAVEGVRWMKLSHRMRADITRQAKEQQP